MSNILIKLDVKFNPEKDFNNTVFNHAYYSTDFNRCVETMHEPVLHDGLSKEDVRKLLGNPEYEAEDVWIYPSGWYLLVFNDGKLNKLALLGVGEHSVDIARIDNALNIDEVRKEIQKRIQEEKEFKEKRDAILNSDEELSKLAAMPSKEMWELLGDDDTEKTGFSGWCPYVVTSAMFCLAARME